ncbi:MAG: Druantia anti-phage system protein DruA [Thermoanaerobaculia bacterium]
MNTLAVVVDVKVSWLASGEACGEIQEFALLAGTDKEITWIEDDLRRRIVSLAENIQRTRDGEGTPGGGYLAKGVIKDLYSEPRARRTANIIRSLGRGMRPLLQEFAAGSEVIPERIEFSLVPVRAGGHDASLFRVATLVWSVPVSQGFGRRMRFLVRDKSNGKLAGILALGDPVFNLGVRDRAIGWSSRDRMQRMTALMDAYVLGAVPPYNMLLGGKVIALMVKSAEVHSAFAEKYGSSVAVISGRRNEGNLVAVTTSSALGRSSLYNRLRINGEKFFERLGTTAGYGHFHIPDELFLEMRRYLRLIGHKYAQGNRFGDGPNWKLRTVRAAVEGVGLDREILLHGVRREVFICRLVENAFEVLRGEESQGHRLGLRPAAELSRVGAERWMIPRSKRRQEYQEWSFSDLERVLGVPTASEGKGFLDLGGGE